MCLSISLTFNLTLMGIMKDFKEFAMRGNVLDLAIAVIIAAAFGKIVSSLVADILMPPLGLLLGDVDFSNLQYVLRDAVVQNGEEVAAAVAIRYGQFIQFIIDFLIVAFAIFMVVRYAKKLERKKKEEVVPAEPSLSTSEALLTEIRDALKKE